MTSGSPWSIPENLPTEPFIEELWHQFKRETVTGTPVHAREFNPVSNGRYSLRHGSPPRRMYYGGTHAAVALFESMSLRSPLPDR